MRARALLAAALALAACSSAPRPPVAASPRPSEGDSSWFWLPEALRQRPDGLPSVPLAFDLPAPIIESLPDGATLYLLEDHAVPLVHVRAIASVGSLDDPEGQEGLAAVLIACMRAGGAGSLGPEDLDDALERSAMLLDAGTSDELSELALDVRSADLERGLELFFDVLTRPRLEPKAVEAVLRRAREGVRRRGDDPSDLASRAIFRALWGARGPAREPSEASLSRIGRADLVALHARAFVPAGTRLLITGDFDPRLVHAAAARLSTSWPPRARAPRTFQGPPAAKPRQLILLARPTAQSKVRIGQLGPARRGPQEESLRLLDAVLGGAPGASRLFNEIRDRRGLAYDVASSIALGPMGGTVLVAADTRPEATRELLERTLEVIEGVRGAAPVEARELALAKDAFVNSFAFRFDTAAKAAYERAVHDALGYPPGYLATERDRILAITPDAVTEAARSALRPESMQIVVVGDPAKLGDLSSFGPVRVIADIEELRP
jgi:zinc protease